MSQGEFTQLVNAAFKNYHSVLALARSPLANSALVKPLLVLDDVSPTADERGHALRLVLQWAVHRLAPGPVRYPIGTRRPLDDPTWRDPHWWRYNILRHRYLDPLHPDEFVPGGRFTETLTALTGIPSTDTFFDERNRAIREVAQWLWQQLQGGHATDELQQMALAAAYRPLKQRPEAEALLGVAATFDDVFPRSLLLRLATEERLPHPEQSLDYLTAHRFLLTGDAGANLWLSPVLRSFVYGRQPQARLLARHRLAATYYLEQHEPLKAAQHLQRAHRWPEAATLLLQASDDLLEELQLEELEEALQAFQRGQLSPDLWREVQILLSDLLAKSGQQTEALQACRRALAACDQPVDQARVYRRMGKLYEKHNQLHALAYYRQASERFPPNHLEFLNLLKDRAWLYILRQEWRQAESDLLLALSHMPPGRRELQADVYDALASLYRHQHQYEHAIRHAQQALALREEMGDLLRVANSFNNLGLIYNDMGDFDHAIAAYQEAMATYQKLENRGLTAGTLLNIGMAYHLDGRLAPAIQTYQECLAVCQEIGLPLVEVRAHYNLAEAYAQMEQPEPARHHWRVGYQLSLRAGFDDEAEDFLALQQQWPILQGQAEERPSPPRQSAPAGPSDWQSLELDEVARCALALAEEHGRVTARQLMKTVHISKATATRRLAALAQQGLLHRVGQGRGTFYVRGAPNPPPAAAPTAAPAQGVGAATPLADLERVARLLDPHGVRLQHCGVEALGVLSDPQAGGQPRLVARFSRLPDVLTFLALEQELATWLKADVRLLPEALLSARAAAPAPGSGMRQAGPGLAEEWSTTQVVWVWQADWIQG